MEEQVSVNREWHVKTKTALERRTDETIVRFKRYHSFLYLFLLHGSARDYSLEWLSRKRTDCMETELLTLDVFR